MKNNFWLLIVLLYSGTTAFTQIENRTLSSSRGNSILPTDNYFAKPVQLVDQPTASILKSGDVRTSLRLYENGGALGRLSVGISKRFNFGISYGGLHIIGRETVVWNKIPGVNFQYRLVEENLKMPAVVLGFDSQGYGPYWGNKNDSSAVQKKVPFESRYSTKSKGFYIVVSKSYHSVILSGLHAGLNYSLEHSDGDKDPDVFLGIDVQISRDLAAMGEFDFAMNDDSVRGVNNGKGLLSAGIRWAFSNNFYLEFDIKDLLSEKTNVGGIHRILKIVYHGSVFSL